MSQNYQNYGRPNRKNGACDCCVRAVKWIPVLFIFSIICWSYYAFVVQLCFLTVENIAEKIILLLLYHIFCFLFLWSYYQTIFVDIALVPQEFRLKSSEVQKVYSAESEVEQKEILEQYARNLPITNRTITGAVRFCDKCCLIKPDRAHHCSVCGDCVLKMDHHCPWVNNCVNFSNYKFFILFLGYALLYCIYIALASLPYFIQFWKGHLEGMGRFHILFLFFVSVMFAISLVSLFGYHIYLVLLNRTTLEAFRAPIFRIGGPDKHGFSLGHMNNFQEVFGDDKRYWFLPVFTSRGNGITFPCQSHHDQPPNYESMGATTTTPNGHSSTIINMNSSPSPSSNNNTNNLTTKNETNRLASSTITPKINSVAPMSDPPLPKSDTITIQNEKEDDQKLFVRRSDNGVVTENGSNMHLLNHNSETMNV